MVLEAIMICADNSEPMRNGDYSPTRLEAQAETINEISSKKIAGNQETQVGIMSMAGRRLEVHLSPMRSIGSITQVLNKEIKVSGESNFSGALKTAQLVLKNRQNKNQRQRIIMFVGSPVKDETKDLVKLAKLLKKNNVAVDIINFGLENGPLQRTKLEEFINAVNSSDNSHLVHVPPGPHELSDMVMISPIMVEAAAARTGPAAAGTSGAAAATGGAAAARPAAGAAGGAEDEDELLAMTLRVSREEERQRQEKLAKDRAAAAGTASASSTTSAASTSSTTPGTPAPATGISAEEAQAMDESADAEEARLLAEAMRLSMADEDAAAAPAVGAPSAAAPAGGDIAEALQDPDFMNSLLASAGVPAEDIAIDDLLNTIAGKKPEPKKEEPKKE